MSDTQCGRLVRALDRALKRRPRSVYLRRLFGAAQAEARRVMEGMV